MSRKQVQRDHLLVRCLSIIFSTLFLIVILSRSNANAKSISMNSVMMKTSALHPNTILRNQYSDKVEKGSKILFKDGVISKTQRFKRSPYPPGFVIWEWAEPCICPPGLINCRCYLNSKSAKTEAKTFILPQKEKKRRVTRSKKNKFLNEKNINSRFNRK